MNIPINIEPSQIIKTYLLCLNPMMKLKKRELEVLEAMMKVYISLKRAVTTGHLKEEDLDKRLNDPMGRKVVRDLIGMSEASHTNHCMQLKKKKVLTEKYELQDFLKQINKEVTDQDFSINYKIKVHIKKDNKDLKLEKANATN